MKPTLALRSFLLGSTILASATSANAVIYIWDGGASGDSWNQAANWNATPTFNADNGVEFYSAAGGLSNFLNTNQIIGSLAFNAGADSAVSIQLSEFAGGVAARTLTLGSGLVTPTITVDAGSSGNHLIGSSALGSVILANNLTVTHNGSGTLTIARPVTGATFGITKAGSGTMILSGANTYDGATQVDGGILDFANKAALGNTAVTAAAAGSLGLGVKASDAAYYSATDVGDLFNTNTLTGFTLNAASGVAIDTTNAGGSFDQTVALTAARALTKIGSGTLTLSTANTYTGGTAITAGTLKLSGAGTLGLTNANVAVSSGALLDLNGTSQSITFAAGTGVGTVANNSGGASTSALTIAGTPSIAGGLVTIEDNTNSTNGKVAVVITANTVSMSNLNTYSGGTTVNSGAYLYLGAASASGAGTGTITLTANGGTGATSSGLVVDGATYANDITGAGYVHSNGGSNATVFTGNITTSGQFIFRSGTGSSYNFAGNATTSSLSGVIGSTTSFVNGAVATGSVIKSGTGILTLSGDSIYTGTTTITGGTLKLGATGGGTNTPLGTNAAGTLVSGTGTLDLAGFTLGTSEALSLAGTGTSGSGALANTGGAATYSGLVTLTGAASIVSDGNINLSNAGTITGATFGLTLGGTATGSSVGSIIGTTTGSLTKEGSGTWTLTRANTYSGGTTVSAGTLTLGNGSALGSAAASVTGGSLDLGGQTITNAISIGALGTLTGSGSTGAATLAGSLTPGGSASGLITMASASVASTSAIALQLAATGTRGVNYDALTVSGPLALDGTVTVTLNGLTPANGQSFDLIDSTGSIGVTNFTVATDLILPALGGGLVWDTSAFVATGVVSITTGGDPYTTWATGGELFADDENGDGVSNGLAFLLGATDPDVNALGLLPEVNESGGNLILTFTCLDDASRGSAALYVEHSGDLGIADPWQASVAVDDDGNVLANGVTLSVVVNPGDSDLNDVTATISSSQAVGNKLFGRLMAVKP